MHEGTLEHVDDITYLGIILNHPLEWGHMITTSSQKQTDNWDALIARNMHPCPEKKPQANPALVRPILDYAFSVWDPYQ